MSKHSPNWPSETVGIKSFISVKNLFCSFLFLLSLIFLSSCTAHKSLPYLTNIDDVTRTELMTTVGIHEARIMPNDILSITVNSAIPGAAEGFNLPTASAGLGNAVQTVVSSSSGGANGLQNYLVDKDGKIIFPILGELKLTGMTLSEVREYIAGIIYPKYINEKPIVTVRFLNFKVAVLGEVNKPGIYESENGQMTIFDALASAGDMTIYGKRKNVLLVRTEDDGEITTYRINMQDKSTILNKDLYYLKQNDKLYVETNAARGNNSRFGTFESVSLSALSVIISVISIITR